jgi:hypothetical protein
MLCWLEACEQVLPLVGRWVALKPHAIYDCHRLVLWNQIGGVKLILEVSLDSLFAEENIVRLKDFIHNILVELKFQLDKMLQKHVG